MHRAVDIIDNFYTDEQLDLILNYCSNANFVPTLQPFKFKHKYASRFEAYPCYETEPYLDINSTGEDREVFNTLWDSVIDLNYHPIDMHTFFRKLFQDEMKKSVCNDGKGLRHKDTGDYVQIAGVVYLDKSPSLRCSTGLLPL